MFSILCAVAAAVTITGSPAMTTLACDDGTQVRIERVYVPVPVSYDDPKGPSYQIAALRAHHPDQTRSEQGTPAVFLAGGPGDSGIRVVEELIRHSGAEFFDLMSGDIIGIDERGVGASEPDLGGPVRYGIPPAAAGDPDRILPIITAAHSRRAEQLEINGIDTTTIHPDASARDVGRVLASLSAGPVNLWGRSYGSHLAIAVDRVHPGLISKLILVCPEGPDQTLKLPANADAAIARLSDTVAASADVGAEMPDLSKSLRRVLDRLQAAPALTPIRVPARLEPVEVGISAWDVRMLIWNGIGDQRRIAEVPRLIAQLERGDLDEVGRIVGAQRATMSLFTPMNRIMDLACGASPERTEMAHAQAGDALLGHIPNFGLLETANAWEVQDAGAAHRATTASETPALILVGDLDPRTPLENVPPLRRVLPHASVITIRNATHSFPLFSDAILTQVLKDFSNGKSIPDQEIQLPDIEFTPFDGHARPASRSSSAPVDTPVRQRSRTSSTAPASP